MQTVFTNWRSTDHYWIPFIVKIRSTTSVASLLFAGLL
jgi:hypothetical protein